MNKLTGQQIRETWLNFFKERGHHVEAGANLIPQNDPTLLWINSGVAALKKYFDGSEVPPARRITNVQKSIRTNDIENVGKTARHQTFFEMLGNFSIGDYFRKEVIPWAFDILTNPKYFGMDKEKIYVTYNPSDIETKQYWIKAGLDESHLVGLESNYWQIGEGPCGPNTEVFFDRGIKYDPENIGVRLIQDELENDRYIEIWGIVFSQYNAENGVERKDYKELPSKNIDTGAGLERIACILQGTETNFETDLFWPTIQEVEKLSGKKYADNKMAFRVIADHVRTCTFALADGEFFSNEGRGYVLRRLLRRAMRYGMELGIKDTFLYQIVPTVVEKMKEFYPYLVNKQEYVMKLIKLEEEKFIKTLRTGEGILEDLISKNHSLSGEDAFKLYDTYGFPFELTEEICLEKGIKLSHDDFEKLMEEQKERARSARNADESMTKQSKDLLDFVEKSEFCYDSLTLKSKVIGLFKDGKKVNSLSDEGYVIFEKTPFYAEIGGQVSDVGIISNEETELKVLKVNVAPNKQHLHFVSVMFGEVKVGDELTLSVDEHSRIQTECNHSATHLLHKALCEVLGEHVEQKGSFVCSDYLRFDFNHFEKLSDDQLALIEKLVNKYINDSIEEKTLVLPYAEAVKTGAEHEFNEKYGDLVRVVTFGDVSKEFCGGTHINNTKSIGIFLILSEESIAAGTRRITACTSEKAYEAILAKEKLIKKINNTLSATNLTESIDRLKSLISELDSLKKQNVSLNQTIANNESLKILENFVKYTGFVGYFGYFSSFTREQIVSISDTLKNKVPNSIAVLIGKEANGSYPIIVSVSKDIANSFNSNKVMKGVCGLLGGSGGGRPDFASGAVKSIDKINEIKGILENLK